MLGDADRSWIKGLGEVDEQTNQQFAPLSNDNWFGNGALDVPPIDDNFLPFTINNYLFGQILNEEETAEAIKIGIAVRRIKGGGIVVPVDDDGTVVPFNNDSVIPQIDDDTILPSIDNGAQEEQTPLPANNVPTSHSVDNEVSAEATSQPAKHGATDPFLPDNEDQEAVQAEPEDESRDSETSGKIDAEKHNELFDEYFAHNDSDDEMSDEESAEEPVDSETQEETDMQTHNRFFDEYFNSEDSDDESSDEELNVDLFKSNFPSIGLPHQQQVSQKSYSNIKSSFTILSELAGIRDPVNRAVSAVSNGSGNAADPNVVPDDDEDEVRDTNEDVPVNGVAQHHQGSSVNSFSTVPAVQAPGPIQRHASIPNLKKRGRDPVFGDEQGTLISTKHHKTAGSDMVSTPQDNTRAFAQATADEVLPHNWAPPRHDYTIPLAPDHRVQYINQLVAAIKDTTTCLDSKNVASFQSRWASLNSTSIINQKDMETAASEILNIAKALHARGLAGLKMRDAAKLKIISKCRDLTFSERIDKICELLRLSKARCDKILRLENLEMVVSAPEHIIKNTKSNRKHNKTREKTVPIAPMTLKQLQELRQGTGQQRNEGQSQLPQQYSLEDVIRKPRRRFPVYRDDVQDQVEAQAIETPARIIGPSPRPFNELLNRYEDGLLDVLLPNNAPSQNIVIGPQQGPLNGTLQDYHNGRSQGFDHSPAQDFVDGAYYGFNAGPPHNVNGGPPQSFADAPSRFDRPSTPQTINLPRPSSLDITQPKNSDPALLSVSGNTQNGPTQLLSGPPSQISATTPHNMKRKPFEPLPRSAYLPVSAPQPPALRQQTRKRKSVEPLPRSAYLPVAPSQPPAAEQENAKRRRLEPLPNGAYLQVNPLPVVQQQHPQRPQTQYHQPQPQQQGQQREQQQHLADPPQFIGTGDHESDLHLYRYLTQEIQEINQQQQQPQLIHQQHQQLPPGHISYGGNMFAPAGTIATGVMPLAPNVSAQNRPLQGQKRGRGVGVDAEGPHGSPPKRRNLGRRK